MADVLRVSKSFDGEKKTHVPSIPHQGPFLWKEIPIRDTRSENLNIVRTLNQ